MRFIESRFYSILVAISNIFILNFLWLISCIPIITIFPATAAMFGVVRQWVVHKDFSAAGPYFTFFKANFKQSFSIGFIWVILALFLFADYMISLKLGFIQNFILPVLLVISFIFLLMSTFLFPAMVHYKVSTRELIKNSLLLSMSYFPISLLILLILAFTLLSIYILPLAGLFMVSLAAYLIYLISHVAFTKVNRMKRMEQSLIK